jgi:hypothetical protein
VSAPAQAELHDGGWANLTSGDVRVMKPEQTESQYRALASRCAGVQIRMIDQERPIGGTLVP